MTLNDFVEKYKGKMVDWDNAYGCQCVDLARVYIAEVLGTYQPPTVTGAWQTFDHWGLFRCSHKGICKIWHENIKRGDLIIWDKTEKNKYGHIAICLKVCGDEYLCLEQNGFTQDGVKIVRRKKDNVLGGLRFIYQDGFKWKHLITE